MYDIAWANGREDFGDDYVVVTPSPYRGCLKVEVLSLQYYLLVDEGAKGVEGNTVQGRPRRARRFTSRVLDMFS